MPGERLSMRKIRELLRLRWEQHLPQRVIANSLRLSQASVSDYLSRARRAGLTWPLPDALDDAGRAVFTREYKARLNVAYPRRADGKTLFPFSRLFAVATI